MPPTRPRPSELQHLRPSNGAGTVAVAVTIGATALGIALATRPFALTPGPFGAPGARVLAWAAGQLILGFALVQWFVVQHECGHDTLFASKRANALVGTIAGGFAAIPFASWRRVHRRHHRWTGWQDLDPTTETLVPRERRAFERAIVNVCWKCSIPLFAVVYRIENYWHLPRLFALFRAPRDRTRLVRDAAALIIVYVALVLFFGPRALVVAIGPAILLSLVAEDVLLLSQHTHIPQHVSHGEPVRPFAAIDQEVFTRSLRLPAWLSTLLLHFDAHELHHMYPFVPGYHLRGVAYAPHNEVGCWRWVRAAKRVPGEVFLFQNRATSGWDV
jgi:acyl-lipid omega-6 desaturase (Delta-12 desaturase)